MADQLILGVDLGGTTTKIAILNTDGEIQHKWEITTDSSNDGEHILPNIAQSFTAKLAELNLSKTDFLGIGIGVPGPVDMEAGIMYEAVNLGWSPNYPVVKKLQDLAKMPVVIDNDANVAALGEMWKGAGEGTKDLVCVTLGTGVGGGMIANGDIIHGVKGAAGEIGHITVVPEHGAPCNCGKTGCLETVASATGIVRIAKEHMQASEQPSALRDVLKQHGCITAKDVFECASNHDKLAVEVIDYVTMHLGLALANVGNALNPEKIVLGGGVSKAGDSLLKPLQAYFSTFAFSTVAKSTTIDVATLENDAGVIGAAWLVLNKQP
ncbi:ROK family glucokinase [Heyndrickxia ginsengihumi]|uniref:Glucokinase n=1 Tax=Heyndrickxia ginsengihumi TaxID=363870 RepID=A0A0A6VB97_9BACI|nr:ROK family glucokinase [Heyndrickxia ginsengihumi]KHD84841.1 glucokinase [Heyndrickxia ginsengihumi]MBE6183770.1 ROK family glucokinase [Bacillus sp. (in: firmicutes)]MCM3022770.1 ROK family glucokinase [Heyndrickxia ginsengihumi]NEY20037.1 ROK family glucokinase [Heyndrickxia ginsengihumi]